MSDTFVILGAGLAGAKAAETLREEGFEGRVVLIGDEPELPYERPPLSKKYLKGEAERDDAHVHPADFYAAREIELLTGARATGLDVDGHRVSLADSRSIGYARLLIATGSVPRRPPIDGINRGGVHVLRTLADADALRSRIERDTKVAIIGAGWIGCEVAAAARELGAEVTLIEQGATPLEGVLGRELGSLYADAHRTNGVNLLTEARVEHIGGGERVDHIRLAGGKRVQCEIVVVGVGITPDTHLGDAGNLEVDNGIVVDEHLGTSAPDVFAAGDVANAFHPRYGRHVRVEHWANALNQGVAAAKSMLDRGEPYTRLPYFYSDQYTVGMEYVGLHDPDDRLVLRGTTSGRQLHAFWLGDDRRITAGLHVNEWDAIEPIKRLIESDAVVDPERLADPRVPLDEVAATSATVTTPGEG
ncbi:MAG TPA: FAD-dependent oxidoreductase [Solirubrobacteraceae bacterium]|nr:FAD-dependent oxidoreductase [Solirubrobacteraceae bacterium]